jgi:hypothetical protein
MCGLEILVRPANRLSANLRKQSKAEKGSYDKYCRPVTPRMDIPCFDHVDTPDRAD